MSYTNFILYGSVLPSYSSGDNESKAGEEGKQIINADNPKNRAAVHKILFND